MRKTEIVAASDQIHPRLKGSETTSGMTRLPRQARQPFSKRRIQAFDKRCVEYHAPSRENKQSFCLLNEAMSHPAGDLDHALFLGALDHRANVQLRPDLQAGSPDSLGLFDLLSERSTDAARVG